VRSTRFATITKLRTSAFTYFAFALGWSWLFWAASVRWDVREAPSQSLLFLIGGAGPFVAAVTLTHLRDAAKTRRDFWIRAFDPRRLRWPWWLASLFLHPAIVGLAFAVDALLGGALPVLEPSARSVPALLSLLFCVFWFGPFPEELGWRGFALDRLQGRMTALSASLTLGSVWALWHVPLFFVPGSYQASLDLGSPRSAIFLASMVPLSVLMTWVYNNTDRSTLSAVLIHYSGNLCGALVVKSDRVAALEFGLLTSAALVVTLVCGARRLTQRCSGPATARVN